MSRESFPIFRYHPDPVATGSVVPSETVCRVCGRERGFTYIGPVYSVEDLEIALCPWCIANGTAHAKFAAEFVDLAGIGDHGRWEAVPRDVAEHVAFRTPGFSGWQQERWFTCCGDACAFLGVAGKAELKAFGSAAVAAIQAECGFDGIEWSEYLEALDAKGGPTAYVFRCIACRRFGGYSDCH